jgi:hypothetical protein
MVTILACQGIFCRDILHLFYIEKPGMAIRLETEGGSVAALLKNHPIFWSSYPTRGHFRAHFRQTSPARHK